jgi:ribosomal protein S16
VRHFRFPFSVKSVQYAVFSHPYLRGTYMLAIRLARGGSKKRPFYHIVATNSRNARDGRFIERLGFFNPIAKGQEETLRIELDRYNYWVGVGGQASDRVKSLVKQYQQQA